MQKKRISGVGLIGRKILVKDASNKHLVGIEGEVVDETRNTIRIKTRDGEKMLVKEQIFFMLDGKTVDGKDMTGRIEERIKRSW